MCVFCCGELILKLIYNYDGGMFDCFEYVKFCDYIIMEGLFGYIICEMCDCYDVKIYFDFEEDLCVKWKVNCDMIKCGYMEE